MNTLAHFLILSPLVLAAFATPLAARADSENPTAPAPQTAQAASDWAQIDLRFGGRRPSLGLHPTSGTPYISFYESVLQRFFLAKRSTNGGISCGGGAGWQCVSANNAATAGTNTSLAWVPYTAEFGVAWDIPADKAYYISRFDSNLNWLGTDMSRQAGPDAGEYDRPTDLMYVGDAFIDAAESAKLNGSSYSKTFRVRRHNGSYDNGVEILEGQHSHGRYASLDWAVGDDGALEQNQIEHVAYRANTGGLRHAYARYDNGGTGCTDEVFAGVSTWSCEWVDPAADVYATDIHATKLFCQGCVDPARIIYYDENSGKLKVASRTGNAAHNCNGGAPGWSCGAIDSIAAGKTVDGIRISMAVGGPGAGQIKIAYTDKDDAANSVLKLATLTGNAGDSCIPGGLTGWSCEIVDDGGAANDNTGWEPSLGWDGENLYIAYYNQSSNMLKVAFPRLALPITFTKAYGPAKILRGSEFTMTYTVQNNGSYPLTGLVIEDYLGILHTMVQVVSNTCGGMVTYTEGNLGDHLLSAGGSVGAGQSCTLTFKMKLHAASAPGAFVDNAKDLLSNESTPKAQTGQSAYTILAAIFAPMVRR